jgi:Holliday junction resolvase RusA-like endonuclease
VTYSSATKELKKWRADLGKALSAARRELGLDPVVGALCVDIVFCIPIKERKRWGEICHTKPDKDNLEKAVLDCMEKAQLFAVSDSQVGVGQTMKVWCSPGNEGAHIQLKRVRVAKKIPAIAGEDDLDWLA